MKYLLTVSIALLFSSCLYAQNNAESRYIEVTVSDSVVLKADTIRVGISYPTAPRYSYSSEPSSMLSDSSVIDGVGIATDAAADDKRTVTKPIENANRWNDRTKNSWAERPEQNLVKLLESEKLVYVKDSRTTLKNIDSPKMMYIVQFTDAIKMKAFQKKLMNYSSEYKSEVLDVISNRVEQGENQLLMNVMQKAKAQVGVIARAGNVQVGRLISVSDQKNNDAQKLNLGALGLLFESMFDRMHFGTDVVLRRTITVRYAIVD